MGPFITQLPQNVSPFKQPRLDHTIVFELFELIEQGCRRCPRSTQRFCVIRRTITKTKPGNTTVFPLVRKPLDSRRNP